MHKSTLWKKWVAALLILLSIFCFGLSSYIRSEVEDGEKRLATGKERLNQGKSTLSLLPRSQMLQNELQKSGEKKIREGEELISYYTSVAQALFIGGVILVVMGGAFFVILARKKS